jgi:hypothetical protein
MTGIRKDESGGMKDEMLVVSPNPASGFIRVSGFVKEPSLLTISVINLLGQEIMRLPAEWTGMGKFSREISVANLPQGAYLLNVKMSERFVTSMFSVVQ